MQNSFINDIFKVKIKKKIHVSDTENNFEQRYFIISDSMILIFQPNSIENKNEGKLIFYTSLAHIDKFTTFDINPNEEIILKKDPKNKDKFFMKFEIKWKESDIYLGNTSSYDNSILMEIDNFLKFEEIINEKRKILFDQAELFSEDYIKYIPSENLTKIDETKLIEIAIYLETNFNKSKIELDIDIHENQSILKEQSKEIVFLYKKIVEILSLKNDENYDIYMSKMQNFIEIAKDFLEDVKESNFTLLDTSFS
jgi:hypothetical protein